MAYRIFLSHSSVNTREAQALKSWLAEQDPPLANEIFLDADRDTGLKVGTRWKEELRHVNACCETVICLLSKHWADSWECHLEFRFAETLSKQILCACLEPSPADDDTRDYQRCNLFGDEPAIGIPVSGGAPVVFSLDGLVRLRESIRGSGIAPRSFNWPPPGEEDRPPYRGWEPFEEEDAAVFFGRDAEILGAIDAMRAMRARRLPGQPRSVFVILGPSGTGKSSFLRAGLLPRLRRDDSQFTLLGIVRPERNALTGDTGLAPAIHSARQSLNLISPPLGDIESLCEKGDAASLAELLTEIRTTAGAKTVAVASPDSLTIPPTLVLPLDQAEELFNAGVEAKTDKFLYLLKDLFGIVNDSETGLIAVATIRSDRHVAMQNHQALAMVGAHLFDELKPMPDNQFKEVITGPADRSARPLEIAPDLVNRLLEDASEGADTLPMLSLVLARLYRKYGSEGTLAVEQYEKTGGLHSVVTTVIDEILSSDPTKRETELKILRDAFIPALVTVNSESQEPMRRLARMSDLPEPSRRLIGEFVDKRLMVTSARGSEVVVEVALESLLRRWDELEGWLREHKHELRAADDLEREAATWERRNRHPDWLLSGSRLEDAEDLFRKPGFEQRLTNTLDYLEASRKKRDEELRKQRERQEAELNQARRQLREATALRLLAEAQGMLAGTRPGGDARAIQQLLAARVLTDSPDDGTLYSAVVAKVNTLRIIDTGSRVLGLDITADGTRIISSGRDRAVRLWDATTGQPIGEPLAGHQDRVDCVALSPDGRLIASAGRDRTVLLWDSATGELVGGPLIGHTDRIRGVAFVRGGERLVTVSSDCTVRVWDTASGMQIGEPFARHRSGVRCVAVSSDGRHFATGTEGRTCRVWNVETGERVVKITGHTGTVRTVAFSPDGSLLATGGSDRTLRVWNVHDGSPRGDPITGHYGNLQSVAFSPDGHRIATASSDQTLRVWSFSEGILNTEKFTGHQDAVLRVVFSPDGQRLITASSDQTIRIWDASDRQPNTRPLIGRARKLTDVAFSSDGDRMVTGGTDWTARLWRTASGTPIGPPLTGHKGKIYGVTFSPDGRIVATASQDGSVRLWDAASGNQIRIMLGHEGSVYALRFASGDRLVSGGEDRTLRLWDAGTGQQCGPRWTGHEDMVEALAISPDGRQVISGSTDTTVRVWDAYSGQPVGEPMTGHDDAVTSVAVSPDGRLIVSGCADGTVGIWEAGELTRKFSAHPGTILGVAISPNGTRLATAGDRTIRLWNLATGEPVSDPLTGHQDAVWSVAFSPDGRCIASCGADGTLRLWPATATISDLCAKLTANMSHQQWKDWVSPDIDYMPVCPDLPVPSD